MCGSVRFQRKETPKNKASLVKKLIKLEYRDAKLGHIDDYTRKINSRRGRSRWILLQKVYLVKNLDRKNKNEINVVVRQGNSEPHGRNEHRVRCKIKVRGRPQSRIRSITCYYCSKKDVRDMKEAS
ncbi:hypothetical protein Lal_00015584 [Lupinus albus]|nr:hypothetical protein Lal_00015584 [Lupinus albus]